MIYSKTHFLEVFFGSIASLLIFINGILASGFGAAAYYLYTYHKCNEQVRREHLDDDPPCEVNFKISTIIMFIILGMFVGFLVKSGIEAYMLNNYEEAATVRKLAAIINPATGIAGFLFMPILDTLYKVPIKRWLEKIVGGR